MGQLIGSNRDQLEFFCLESSIAGDSIVRAIEALVDFLPLADLGFIDKGTSRAGRPAYSGSSLLKLYLYGYINRVRSSRGLEREVQTNLEAMWLLKGLRPCFRTIADFRQHNSEALLGSFKAFNQFLRGEDLFSLGEVATDGTKIRGQNSRKNNYNEKKINQHLNYIDNQIAGYLEELDQVDLSEAEEHQEEKQLELAQKLDHMTQRRQKYERLSAQMDATHEKGITQISTTDPDTRALPKKMNIVEVGYNVVATAESKNKLITNFEVRNTHDTYALSEAGLAAREVLGKKPGEKLRQLADKGFDTGSELKRCQEHDIETYVAPKNRVNVLKDKAFNKDKFTYDEQNDTYICPENQVLTTNGRRYKKNNGKLRSAYHVKHYKLPFSVCNGCVHRLACAGAANLNNSKGRYIERSEYQDYIDENTSRTERNKERYRKRQELIEHQFGTIKRQWGYDYTLLKGLEKVRGEWAIIFMVYNLKRCMSILGEKKLRKRLREAMYYFFTPIEAILAPFSSFLFYMKLVRQNKNKPFISVQIRGMSLSRARIF